MRNRKHQRGFSTLAVLLYNCLIFTGYGLVAAVVVGTFYFVGRARPAGTVFVACFWLGAWSYTSFWGAGPQKWAMRLAVPACEDDIGRLSKRIETDSVIDESAFLTLENVKNLLMVRELSFVEIKVRPDSESRTRYLHPSEGDLLGIAPRLQEGKVVKLDLGKQGDASCVKSLSDWRRKPESCIRINLLEEPTAQYSVRHSLDNSPMPFAVGNWILFDRTRNVEVARISTYDTSNVAQLGNPATIQEVGALTDCRGAHALIFANLYGPRHSRPAN